MSNMIPGMYAEGSFTAKPPFDKVVNPNTYFTVEALRTVDELRAADVNLYTTVFSPVGILEEDGEDILNALDNNAGVVIVLTAAGIPPVYLPSSYLLSFPAVDGVKYERMALIVDLGAVPPKLKEVLAETQKEIQDLVLNRVGVDNTVNIGVVPTTSYVKAGQANIFETTRLNRIKDSKTNVLIIKELETKNAKQEEYIKVLEAKILELSNKP